MTTAAAVLAAGGGTRFGPASKLRASFRGRPLVVWAVEHARAAGFDDVLVVVGADRLDDVLPSGVDVVENRRWTGGIATSLAAAVDACRARGHDGVVVGLGDQPFVDASVWRTVGDRGDAPIIVPTFEGVRGHPVRLDRSVWSLLPAEGDVGARRLMAERPDLVAEIPCAGNPADIDTQEDLTRWS